MLLKHWPIKLILLLLLFSLCACNKREINTETPSLPSTVQDNQISNSDCEPLHFYDESLQKGAYIYNKYDFVYDLMHGQMKDGSLIGFSGDGTKNLVQTKDGNLTELEIIPGYDWLAKDDYCSEHYLYNNFRLMDTGEFVCGFAQNGSCDGQYFDISGTSSLIVGNAEGFEKILTAESGLVGDIFSVAFDPVRSERCVIVSNDNGSKRITFYNWKTREIVYTGPMDTYNLPLENEMAILGDVLYYYARTNLRMYRWDMNTGDALETVEFFNSAAVSVRDNYWSYAIGATNNGKGLLLVDQRGVFYMDPEQDFAETVIIPAKNQPFSAPTTGPVGILQLTDGSILIDYYDTAIVEAILSDPSIEDPTYGHRLLRYTYDPDYDRHASSLEVYSLENNATMTQAVSVYTDSNPNVDVDYVVGMEGGLSSDDALTALTTRILAGNGPDVLLMDGLPLARYMEKGALADISDLLPAEDECYSGVVNAYRQPDGAVYAVSARFAVPTLLGKDVSGVKTLQNLAKWADTFEQKDFGIGSRGIMHTFFPLYAKDWIVNGQFQADVFHGDLEAMGRICEQWRATTLKPVDKYQYNDASFMAYNWFAGAQCGAFGDYKSIESLIHPYSAIRELGGELVLYGEGVFTPSAIVAQSSLSRNPQEAKALIQTLLGEDVQATNLKDGFSILRSVVEGQKESSYGKDYTYETKISWLSPLPEVTMKEYWPKAHDIDAFVSVLDTLTVPANVDYTLRDLFIEETLPYLLGEETIDACIQRLTSKIGIYLAE